MKHFALMLTFCAGPAAAWEFSPLPICTLSHPTGTATETATGTGAVTVTYDPGNGTYAIRLEFVTANLIWPEAPRFEMLFTGARPLQIGTDRHQISDDRRSLTVTDSGFGNVLDGLQFNEMAQATAGDVRMAISLAGAADPVIAFRACATAATS